MKENLTEDDIKRLLDGVIYLKAKLARLNHNLDILEKSLGNLLEYPEDLYEFQKRNETFNLKCESLSAASEFFKLLNSREEIVQELKKVYKEVFIRESEVISENPFYGWCV